MSRRFAKGDARDTNVRNGAGYHRLEFADVLSDLFDCGYMAERVATTVGSKGTHAQ
jgi:hypothetical protein